MAEQGLHTSIKTLLLNPPGYNHRYGGGRLRNSMTSNCYEKDSTHWRRVIFDGDVKPWILKQEVDRGLCAFATKSFKAGELVCREYPMVWIHGHHPFNSNQLKDISNKILELDDADKEAFYDMANVFKGEIDECGGIFMTNSFDMTGSIFGECCAMYVALARLNHSCAPNVQQTHYPDTMEEVLYATRDIQIGDEINDCYIEVRQTTTIRKKELKEYFRFDCQCVSCATPSIHQDTIRQRAYEIDDILIDLIKETKYQEAYDLAISTLKTLTTPVHLLWSPRYLPELHLMSYQIANFMGKNQLAKDHLMQAYQLNLQYQGERSPDTIKCSQMLKNS